LYLAASKYSVMWKKTSTDKKVGKGKSIISPPDRPVCEATYQFTVPADNVECPS